MPVPRPRHLYRLLDIPVEQLSSAGLNQRTLAKHCGQQEYVTEVKGKQKMQSHTFDPDAQLHCPLGYIVLFSSPH